MSQRKDANVVIQHRRIEKGCGKLFDQPKVVIDNLGFHSCLCHESFQNPNLGDYIQLYQMYKAGHLPDIGGALDQSAKTMEIINLIESLYAEQEIEMQKKAAKEQKR